MATSPDNPKIDPVVVKELLESSNAPDLPHFYFNGFGMVQGVGDVTVILKLNNKNVAAINCSFTLSKTLSTYLGDAIKTLENKTGKPIFTTDEITRLFAEAKGASGNPQ